MKFILTNNASHDLFSLDYNLQKRIISKVKFFCDQDNPMYFAKALNNCNWRFRFRIWDYRVIFTLEENKIIILMIWHRKEIYE